MQRLRVAPQAWTSHRRDGGGQPNWPGPAGKCLHWANVAVSAIGPIPSRWRLHGALDQLEIYRICNALLIVTALNSCRTACPAIPREAGGRMLQLGNQLG